MKYIKKLDKNKVLFHFRELNFKKLFQFLLKSSLDIILLVFINGENKMRKVKFLVACALVSISALHANESLNEAKDNLITSQLEYTKAAIEHKCQKLQKKIRKCEDRLAQLNDEQSVETDNSFKVSQEKKLLKKIQKYEDKISNLYMIKFSMDNISPNI